MSQPGTPQTDADGNLIPPEGYAFRMVGGGFAGMGELALVCLRCGSLVLREDPVQQLHDYWHQALEQTP